MVEISLPGAYDFYRRLELGEQVFISMEYSEEVNIWYEHFHNSGLIFFSVFLSLMAFTNVVISLWRLANFIRAFGVAFTLAQMIMTMILISNILKLVYLAVDPIFSRNIFSYMASQVLNTMTFPISAITTLLITFYWHEVLKKTSAKAYFNLHKKRFIIPSIIFSILIFALEISTSVLRGFQYNVQTISIVATSSFLAVLVVVNIYCLYIGGRVLHQISKSPSSKKSKRTNRLKTTTRYIIASAITTTFTIPFLVLIWTDAFRNPPVFIAVYFFLFFFLTLGDFFKLLAFGTPSSSVKTSSSSNNSTPKKKKNPKRTAAASSSKRKTDAADSKV